MTNLNTYPTLLMPLKPLCLTLIVLIAVMYLKIYILYIMLHFNQFHVLDNVLLLLTSVLNKFIVAGLALNYPANQTSELELS